MDGDPFARILAALTPEESDSSPLMREGEIVSRDPLSVEVAGLKLKKDALRLDKRLKQALASELAQGIESTLARGSRVLLLTLNDQTFYVICEVVSA